MSDPREITACNIENTNEGVQIVFAAWSKDLDQSDFDVEKLDGIFSPLVKGMFAEALARKGVNKGTQVPQIPSATTERDEFEIPNISTLPKGEKTNEETNLEGIQL